MSSALSSAHERVAREDLVMFVNACFACTGQREYYGTAYGQAVSIEFLHEYTLVNYRRLYARTLAAGINHFNQALIIVNLLATGRDVTAESRAEEGALIGAALRRLPPPRAYRALEELRARRVNNRRARAVAAAYLASRPDAAFDAVKYRSKLRVVAVHAHLRLPGELAAFLHRGFERRTYETPIFETFRQAHYAREAVFRLPYTVAEGLAAKHGIPRAELIAKTADQMTLGEKLRLQRAAERTGAEAPEVELSRVGLTRLAIYVLALSAEERAARHDELDAALDGAARRAWSRAPLGLGRVAAVLDRSWSSSGSEEKRRRPLAVALAVSRLLRAASREYRAFWTVPLDDDLTLEARGQTDLAEPLLAALEWGADQVIIVSDGFENSPPRGAAEVARVFRERIDRQRRVSLVHVNPVFDDTSYAPRTLGAALPTVGLRDAEDLLTMLGFARFADGTAPLDELETYLARRVGELLDTEGGAR